MTPPAAPAATLDTTEVEAAIDLDDIIPATPNHGRLGSWKLGIPFVLVHVACLAVVVVGWSPVALGVAVALYLTRAFGITAFYHRCFSHRAFRTNRAVQLAGAVLGAAAAQRGPLWWVAHHRVHHRYTDRPGDVHSPRVSGAAWSHVLWIFAPANQSTDLAQVPDLARYRELRVLDRFHHLVPGILLGATYGLGALLGWLAPGLHTSGPQMLVWGFAISTVALYHSTFAVNSVAHTFGRRRFDTRDDSRNNWLVALLVLGEGWHNNHHRYPVSARQGFARWELDPTWWGIRVLAALKLVHSLRPVPPAILELARRGSSGQRKR
ncbi:MAG TPA: acyl-CoA desaturase [Acidimicrobiales bacterium]|nr:acyl-CoA desaturase [Acidimicrobiales bacterium]